MDKAGLRAKMSELGAVGPDVEKSVVGALRAWLSPRLPGTISAYLAMPEEVDVAPLFDLLPGWQWVLPRVEPDRSLTFRDRDVAREVHRFGMEQPAAEGVVTPVNQIDVILVPGTAFDRSGGRLGKGGGFYDRVLPQRRADALAVGVTTLSRVVDAVPMEPHDRYVDWLATEDGVKECPTRR
jgi:5-formyltetrahydrofolate cyclo-ligase